ncbi:MAG: caspase family protein [Bacteroidota bacterium]
MKWFLSTLLVGLSMIGFSQQGTLGLPVGHSSHVGLLSISPDGQYLVSGSRDGGLILWELASGRPILVSPKWDYIDFPNNRRGIFSSDQRYFDFERQYIETTPTVWDLKTNTMRDPIYEDFRSNEATQGSHFDQVQLPELRAANGNYYLCDPKSGKQVFSLTIEQSQDRRFPQRFRILSNGLWVCFGLEGLFLYDPLQERMLFDYRLPTEAMVQYEEDTIWPEFTISADEKLLIRSRPDGSIVIQDLKTAKLIHILKSRSSVNYYLNLQAPHQIELLDIGGQYRVWDLKENSVFSAQQTQSSTIWAHTPWTTINQKILIDSPQKGYYVFDPVAGKTAQIFDASVVETDWKRPQFDEVKNELILNVNSKGGESSWVEYLKFNTMQTQRVERPHPDFNGIQPVSGAGILMDNSENYSVYQVFYQDRSTGQVIRTGEPIRLPFDNSTPHIFFSPSGRLGLIPDSEEGDTSITTLYDFEFGKNRFQLPSNSVNTLGEPSFSANEELVALPTNDGRVHVFNTTNGQKVIGQKMHTGPVITIAFLDNESRIMSSGQDGKTVIWNFKTGAMLATLIPINLQDWVVLGPNGLFDASPGAMEDLFYIVEENGKRETIDLESLKPRYYEPGLLQKQLGFSTERIRDVENLETIELFPKIQADIENDLLTINLTPRSGGLGELDVFINGKEVFYDPNEAGKTNFSINLRAYQQFLYRHPDSTNIVGVQTYNREGWLKSPIQYQAYEVSVWQRGNDGSSNAWVATALPKMYVLTIGTSEYTGDQLDLKYADVDALAMANAISSVGSQLFTNGDSLEVMALTTSQPNASYLQGKVQHQFSSKENIVNQLKSIQAKAKAEDIVIVYLSGHGVTYGGSEKAQFYYLTHGVSSEDLSDKAIRDKYTLSSNELTRLMNQIPALKQVLVIDACQSGKLVEDLSVGTRTLNSSQIRALDRMKDRTGLFILSGSAANKVSYEASEFGQGLLTYSLLQGMQGRATRQDGGGNYVDIIKLFQFARDEVPKLAKSIRGIQTPMVGIPKKASSFDIGIVNERVTIQMNKQKPIVIRSNFMNMETANDNLKLTQLFEQELRLESEKGRKASLLFIDVSEKKGAYKLSGLYSNANGSIQLNPKLYKDGQLITVLILPSENDPDTLIENILEALLDEIDP